MTDSLPGFTFDPKTGELQRCGRIIALAKRQAQIFRALQHRSYDTAGLAARCEMPYHAVPGTIYVLRRHLAKLGLQIAAERFRGYSLVVGQMPKWKPKIPPPVCLERQAPLIPWTDDEIERGIALRVERELIWEQVAAALGRPVQQTATKIGAEITRRKRADGDGSFGRVSRAQIEVRDERNRGYDERDLTSVLFGDPPRGFSALDEKQRGAK